MKNPHLYIEFYACPWIDESGQQGTLGEAIIEYFRTIPVLRRYAPIIIDVDVYSILTIVSRKDAKAHKLDLDSCNTMKTGFNI